MYNRRNFIKIGGLATVGGLLIGGNFNLFGQMSGKNNYFPIPATIYSDRLNSFSQQIFEPLLNTNFTIVENDVSAVSLRLVEIVGNDPKKNTFGKVATDGFLLVFEADGKISLEDRIYNFSHSELGEFSMFVSTVGRSGKRYQAAFSRVYF